eukprot:1192851-Prorocentrum_minimum.AAC.5
MGTFWEKGGGERGGKGPLPGGSEGQDSTLLLRCRRRRRLSCDCFGRSCYNRSWLGLVDWSGKSKKFDQVCARDTSHPAGVEPGAE